MEKSNAPTKNKKRNHFVPVNVSSVSTQLTEERKKEIERFANKILSTPEPVMQRRIPPRKKSLRRELECYVIAWNTVLREAVKSMDIITLMRNAHPAYRATFAGQLVEAGMLGNEEAKEFRTGPTLRSYSYTWS